MDAAREGVQGGAPRELVPLGQARCLLLLLDCSWIDGGRECEGVANGEADDNLARFLWYEDGACDELEIR